MTPFPQLQHLVQGVEQYLAVRPLVVLLDEHDFSVGAGHFHAQAPVQRGEGFRTEHLHQRLQPAGSCFVHHTLLVVVPLKFDQIPAHMRTVRPGEAHLLPDEAVQDVKLKLSSFLGLCGKVAGMQAGHPQLAWILYNAPAHSVTVAMHVAYYDKRQDHYHDTPGVDTSCGSWCIGYDVLVEVVHRT